MRKLAGVAVFSGMLTLLRLGAGFIIAKLVAVYAGPAGFAMLGQVQNLSTVLTGIVAAPAGTGVVHYTAAHQKDGFESCAPWWKAASRWLLLLLMIAIPLTCALAGVLSRYLFGDVRYAWVIVIAAVVLPFNAVNTLLASVLNGLEQYRKFIGLGFLSVFLSTALMIILTMAQHLVGALVAAALFTAVSGFVLLGAVLRQPWFKWRYWWGAVNVRELKGIGAYILMTATSAVCIPVSTIVIRNFIADFSGWEQAGNWHAVTKISEAYLGVITLALSTYYLPRLSSLRDATSIRREVGITAVFVFPLGAILAFAVYMLRDVVISVLFTQEFVGARALFSVQLIGDVFKIVSWVLAYPMLARGATVWFVGTEVGFSLLYVALARLSIPTWGAQGANAAFAITYVVYLVFLAATFRKFALK